MRVLFKDLPELKAQIEAAGVNSWGGGTVHPDVIGFFTMDQHIYWLDSSQATTGLSPRNDAIVRPILKELCPEMFI